MTGKTPIIDRLIAHAGRARASLHVPGHHSGRLLPDVLSAWLGPAAKLDLTELPGLDNLAAPEDCIDHSQRLAADFYGSDRTFYCVGGSTQGILAALYATVMEDSRVLFLNPFHQSAWHGLVVRNAWPVTLPESFDPEELCVRPPSAETVYQALRHAHSSLSAVYLTSPTYEGFVADVAEIANVVHQFDLPLVVDEAHGAHLGLASGLPPHSVACGADVVVQSVHKMLPGLTQTAWLHVQGKRVSSERISRALRLFQTTSPSYLLLASLDAVQAWLHSEGHAAAEETLRDLERFGLLPQSSRMSISEASGITVRDPLKLWLPTGSIESSRAIASELANEGIDVEYANPLGVLMLPGFNPPQWLLERLQRLFQATPAPTVHLHSPARSQLNLTLSPRAVHEAGVIWLPLAEAVGRICGGAVTPYPPGVPIIYPGEMITAEMAESAARWAASGYSVHGLSDDGRISVTKR